SEENEIIARAKFIRAVTYYYLSRLYGELPIIESYPVCPYKETVPARRTKHIVFNDLKEPEIIPKGTDFASVIESTVPIVVQHTRLDSRQAENALLSTIAYASPE
ncbi:MAG: sensory rhodopsin transducer, partial [Desulfobacterales bacterium]